MFGTGQRRFAAALAALVVISGGTAAAQQGGSPPRWELGVAWGPASPAFGSEYESDFTPVLAYHPETTGSAGQTLVLEADDADFLAATLGVRLGPALGVRLLVGRHEPDIVGSSTDYGYVIRYNSRQPPSYEPRPVELSRYDPWPDPAGTMEQWTVALELTGRTAVGRAVELGASGGVAAFRIDGAFSSLGYTEFSEGGHAVLFADTFVADVEFEPTWAYGLAAGVEASVRISSHLSAVLEARGFWGSEQDVDLEVTSVTYLYGGFPEPPAPAEVEEALAPAPLPVDPSFVAVTIGLRVAF